MIPHQRQQSSLTNVQETRTPGYSPTFTTNLRYYQSGTLAITSGIPSTYVFAANGLYDPDVAFGGHQPMFFDQVMLSYNHYVGLTARATVTFKNLSSNTTTCCLRVDPDTTPITDITRMMEFGAYDTEALEAKGVYGANKTVTSFIDVTKVQGLRNLRDDPNMRGTIASNPAEMSYFHVMAWDQIGNSSSVFFEIVIDFKGLFLEPRVLSTSIQRTLHLLICDEEKKQAAAKLTR